MTEHEEYKWKLVITDEGGKEQSSYYYTHQELEFPEQRAKQRGAKTQVHNLDHQRKWWKLRTEELLQRVRTGMATTQDAIMVEKLVWDLNDRLPDAEKFLDKG